jgi:uncharacterized membrane protein
MKTIRKWFLSGIAVALPLGVTVFVLIWLFNLLDNILAKPVAWILGRQVPGVGLAAIIILIFIVGMLTSNWVGKKIFGWFHGLIEKIPIIKTIYNPVSKISRSISSENTDSFQKVVMVEFPNKGVKSIGFITNHDISLNNKDKVFVFIPTTPNPTNGFLVIMDRKDVDVMDIPINEGLNMVISMGSAAHGDMKTFPYTVNEE